MSKRSTFLIKPLNAIKVGFNDRWAKRYLLLPPFSNILENTNPNLALISEYKTDDTEMKDLQIMYRYRDIDVMMVRNIQSATKTSHLLYENFNHNWCIWVPMYICVCGGFFFGGGLTQTPANTHKKGYTNTLVSIQ